MGDYLIMPIQRIPRYNMLLGDLYSNTWPFHVDYENLGNAHKVKTIAFIAVRCAFQILTHFFREFKTSHYM